MMEGGKKKGIKGNGKWRVEIGQVYDSYTWRSVRESVNQLISQSISKSVTQSANALLILPQHHTYVLTYMHTHMYTCTHAYEHTNEHI